MSELTSRDKLRSVLRGPLLPALLVVVLHLLGRYQPFDDAYITYRYARNLAAGFGFVYNFGEQVLGTTSPFYALLLAALGALFNPASIPAYSFWLATASDIAVVILLFRLAQWIFESNTPALAASIAYALHPFRVTVALGGMESSLFVALILLTYVLLFVDDRPRQASIAGALALLTRPEALLALGPLFIWWIFANPHRIGAVTLPAMALLIPWFIFATSYFGSALPNSVAAKAISYNYPAGFGAYFYLTFLGTGTLGPYLRPIPVLAAAAASAFIIVLGHIHLWKRQPAALLVTQFPLVYGAAVIATNAPAYFPWYYQPLLPALLISALAGSAYLFKNKTRIKSFAVWGMAGLLVVIPTALLQLHPSWPISREREAAYRHACAFLSPSIQPEATVLAPDIGVLGWCLDRTEIVDPIGLVSPDAIKYAQSLPASQHLSAEFIETTEPDYIIALEQYLTEPLQQDPFFTSYYSTIWQTPVTITGDAQELLILKKAGN